MRKEKQIEKIRNTDPINDWMNDFEIPQTNEWQKKIFRKYQIIIKNFLQIIIEKNILL